MPHPQRHRSDSPPLASGARTAAAVLLVTALVGSLTAVPAVAATDRTATPAEPSFVVELEADGDATVIVTMTYDLTADEERDAFESLRDDDEAKQDAVDRFESRLEAVANETADRVDRSMTVTDASVDLAVTNDGDRGVVELRATWTGLAAVEDDRLIVTEPFASGFTPDRPFTLVGPDGYEVTDATPEPDERTTDGATWAAGATLEDFAVTFETTEEGDESDDAGSGDAGSDDAGGDGTTASEGESGSDGLPGFGLLAAVLGLGLACLVGISRLRLR